MGMNYFLYNILVSIISILTIPIFTIKTILSRGYNYNIMVERLGLLSAELKKGLLLDKKNGKKIIWFHAGSIGELVITKKLLSGLEDITNEFSFVVSTGGRSGRNIAAKYFRGKSFLLPFDCSWIIKRVIKKINPDLVVMVEPELWPNFIKYSSLFSHIILLNAWFNNKNSGQFRYFPAFFSDIISSFCLVSLQDKKSLDILKDMGVKSKNIKVTGNIKFDIGERSIKFDTKLKKKEYRINPEKQVIVAGSTHSGEEEVLLDIYRTLSSYNKQLVLIIAPRHIERVSSIIELIQKNNFKVLKKSDLVSLKEEKLDYDVIILDTLGELMDLYSIATVVFVGGSLVPKGGHNLYEPVLYGKTVFFGPYISDVREMADLVLEYKIGYKVKDKEELLRKVKMVLEDNKLQKEIKESSRRLLAENEGILKKNINYIVEYIKKG